GNCSGLDSARHASCELRRSHGERAVQALLHAQDQPLFGDGCSRRRGLLRRWRSAPSRTGNGHYGGAGHLRERTRGRRRGLPRYRDPHRGRRLGDTTRVRSADGGGAQDRCRGRARLPIEAILPRVVCFPLSLAIVALAPWGLAEPRFPQSTDSPASVDESATSRAEQRIRDARSRVEATNYVHWFGSLALGRGLRFNNPYRLERVLGDDAESLSLSALYADVSAGMAQGDPSGLQHGLAVHLSLA